MVQWLALSSRRKKVWGSNPGSGLPGWSLPVLPGSSRHSASLPQSTDMREGWVNRWVDERLSFVFH